MLDGGVSAFAGAWSGALSWDWVEASNRAVGETGAGVSGHSVGELRLVTSSTVQVTMSSRRSRMRSMPWRVTRHVLAVAAAG